MWFHMNLWSEILILSLQDVLGEWAWSSPLEILQAWGAPLQGRSLWQRCFDFVLLAGSLMLMEAQAGDFCSICPIQALASPFGYFLPQIPVESRRAGIWALPFLLNYHIFPLYYGDISGPNKLTLYGRFDWDVAESRYVVIVKHKH